MSQFDELPEGWYLEEIHNLCDFGPRHSKKLSDDLEISFVPMSSVDDVTGTIQEHEVRRLGEVKKGYTHFVNGDVIFAKITPCMENGKAAVAADLINGIACGSTEFHVLRSNGSVLPDYIYRYLRQQSYRDNASQAMTGAVGQRRVPKQFLLETKLPLPPLNEQRRIVEKIEALTDRSRKARAALDQIPALLDQCRQSVLAAAFRGDLTADWRAQNPEVESAEALLERIRVERHQRWEEAELEKMKGKGTIPKDAKWKEKYKEPVGLRDTPLTQLPDGWIWANVAQLSNSTLGKMLDKAKHQSGKLLPYLRNVNVRWGSIDTSDVLKMYFEDDEYERYAVKKGDVLICEGGEPGRAAVWEKDEEIKYQKALHRLRPSGGINSYWFVYHLWLDAINGSLEQHYSGSHSDKGQVNYSSLLISMAS